jgi:hypothetical protein
MPQHVDERRPEGDGAPGKNEIEITPEMIEAGLLALYQWDDALRDDECLIGAVYKAMEFCRRHGDDCGQRR